jgi:predicted metal-dependent hydrolase
MKSLFARKRDLPGHTHVEVDGEPVRVGVRHSARARSYRLRIDFRVGPVLTVPTAGNWGEAERFLLSQANWLGARLKRVPVPVPFVAGAIIPVRDLAHQIVSTPRLRGRVAVAGGVAAGAELLVPGGEAHLARRLTDWLKAEARRDLEQSVAAHSATLGVRASKLRIGNAVSRWGSCSSGRVLSFNWRLILAPPFVLDYVGAHEVAHLVEMNHSEAFWQVVGQTLPDMAKGRAWLKAHGGALHAYGS